MAPPAAQDGVVFAGAPVLCGHRGSGRGVVAGERENTLGSFRAAVAADLPWVEVDARVNADGVLVACHDPVTEDGRFVAALTTEETDAAGLMRVEDLLADLPAEVGLDVDLKTSLEDALLARERTTAARVAALVAGEARWRPLLVTSFDPAALLVVRERAPDVALGLITWTRFPLREAIPAAVHLGARVLVASVGSFPLPGEPPRRGERALERSIAVAHDAGLQVAAWCPSPEETEVLLSAGVDCCVVDHAVS